MIDITMQNKGRSIFAFSEEDYEELTGTFRRNQLIRSKLYGMSAEKERSLPQLAKYFVSCKKVSLSCKIPGWNTKDNVDFRCRVALHFVDPSCTAVRPDGAVQFRYRSISVANLKHIMACKYFDRAFPVMANALGCTLDELMRDDRPR